RSPFSFFLSSSLLLPSSLISSSIGLNALQPQTDFLIFRNICHPCLEIIKDGNVANTKSWGCFINSFDDLEAEYVQWLKTHVGHNRVFSVGPLSLVGPDVSDRGNLGSVSDINVEVLTWLDRCPDGSVVYVCLGSQKLLRKEQMEALAKGLEKSGTRFIWW
ncbi:hypothetical protein Gorai_000045, partial [Gossypium raimondii]|nr:hypothetical protein [Gossypium raimondii]